MRSMLLLLLIPSTFHAADTLPASRFALGQEETIIFVGDSITQGPIEERDGKLFTRNGFYVLYVENYLVTRFPDRKFRIVNSGRSSETLSGLSEAHHPGPRPCLFDRFAKDVADFAPTRVVSCYGINDGIYHPCSEGRFAKYQDGVKRLTKLVREDLQAQLLLMTPPLYDSKNPGQPDARPDETYGYKQPFADYDQVMTKYSAWLMTQAKEGVAVADVHSRMVANQKARRLETPGLRLSADGIHPTETGHVIMAMAVLQAWNAPAIVDEVHLDANTKNAVAGTVKDVIVRDGEVAFHWKSKLPMPLNHNRKDSGQRGWWDPKSLAIEKFSESLNRHTLKATGLVSERYQLLANDTEIGVFSRNELEAGLDLTKLDAFPTTARSDQVRELVMRRRKLGFDDLRKTLPKNLDPKREETRKRRMELDQQLHDLCQPMELRIRLLAVRIEQSGSPTVD